MFANVDMLDTHAITRANKNKSKICVVNGAQLRTKISKIVSSEKIRYF